MPLINLKCSKCRYESEELVGTTGKYPPCPNCGGELKQNYSARLSVNYAGGKKHCGGDCKHCGGCK